MSDEYIPGEDCQCSAYNESECGCDVDWTSREVYDLREQRDRLAEALLSTMSSWITSPHADQATKALAAVKGGSDE